MVDRDYSLERLRAKDAFVACCNEQSSSVELIEWLLSITLIVVGAMLFAFPNSIDASHMSLLALYLPGWGMGIICMWIGAFRFMLILRNRPDEIVYMMRWIMAGISSLIWIEMAAAFAHRFVGVSPPPGIAMLFIMQVAGEAGLIWRIRRRSMQLRRKGIMR